MSFTTENMTAYSQRCKAFMASLQNLRQEAAKLQAVYWNEANGSENWDEVNGITAAEHTDALTMFEDLEKFCGNEAVSTADRQQWITPFVQDA